MNQFNKTDYIYTHLFCEENIWHLAQSLINEGIESKNIQILFLTNRSKQIVIFNQLSAGLDEAVVWDYHVILMAEINHQDYIFDFDSRLEFPCVTTEYFEHSLPADISLEYKSKLRVIPSVVYLQRFESDRSHMQGIIPQSQFPNYPVITSSTDQKIQLYILLDSNKEIEGTYFK